MATGLAVYRGKLNYHSYAKKEGITAIFPEGVYGDKKALLYWQWTTNSDGDRRANENFHGIVDSMKVRKDGTKTLGIGSGGEYRFDGELSRDGLTLTLTMENTNGITEMKSSVMGLTRLYPS